MLSHYCMDDVSLEYCAAFKFHLFLMTPTMLRESAETATIVAKQARRYAAMKRKQPDAYQPNDLRSFLGTVLNDLIPAAPEKASWLERTVTVLRQEEGHINATLLDEILLGCQDVSYAIRRKLAAMSTQDQNTQPEAGQMMSQ